MPRLNSNFWNEENKTKLIKTIIKYVGYGTRVGCIREMLKAGHYKEHNVGSLEKIIKTIEDSGKLDKSLWKKITDEPQLGGLHEEVLIDIKKQKNPTIGSLSRSRDRSEDTIKKCIAELNEKGFAVSLSEDSHIVKIGESKKLDSHKLRELKGEEIKIGVVSDTHLISRYSQLSLLNLAYEKFEEERVGCVLHCGDLTDGNGKIYRGHQNEVFENRSWAVVDYVVKNYPKIDKVSTLICSGNHDLSWTRESGTHIIRQIAMQRDDIIWRGDEAADFEFKNIKISMLHPGQSGSAYAKSYKAQKAVESEVSNTLSSFSSPPDLVLTGHFHFYGVFRCINTFSVMCGCLQAQTPFMRNKALSPDVGFLIIKINYKDRIIKFEPQWYSLNHLVREGDY